jgi:hypothetical protein
MYWNKKTYGFRTPLVQNTPLRHSLEPGDDTDSCDAKCPVISHLVSGEILQKPGELLESPITMEKRRRRTT